MRQNEFFNVRLLNFAVEILYFCNRKIDSIELILYVIIPIETIGNGLGSIRFFGSLDL